MQRDALIILGLCVVAILVGAALFFMWMPVNPPSQGKAVAVTVLSEGTDATGTARKNYRISNAEQLEEVWSMAHGQTVDALPQVDFDTEEVLAVFDGQHPSGGYSVAVSGVSDEGGKRKIVITHKSPGPGCVTTQAITYPFQIVLVPKSEMSIDRSDRDLTVACD